MGNTSNIWKERRINHSDSSELRQLSDGCDLNYPLVNIVGQPLTPYLYEKKILLHFIIFNSEY
jgi:hypothetical protein